jgi:ribosomal protein S18 acetylase RimI-like enzyme
MSADIRRLTGADRALLGRVADDVFDHAVNPALAAEFLDDPRHHLVVAVDGDAVVGFVSAVHYVHPDKPAELWINEVGVAPTHQGRGIAKALLTEMLAVGRDLDCREAWVLTNRSNTAAMRLYASCGGNESDPDLTMFSFPLVPS